jgi:hypothetical protein
MTSSWYVLRAGSEARWCLISVKLSASCRDADARPQLLRSVRDLGRLRIACPAQSFHADELQWVSGGTSEYSEEDEGVGGGTSGGVGECFDES